MSTQYIRYPASNGGGVPIYATFGAFPAGGTAGDLGVAADTGNLYEWDGAAWQLIAGPGAALSLGNLDAQAGTAKGAALTLGILSMQSASVTVPGLVNNTTQSFSGNKTFSGTIAASNLSGTNTGDVTIGTASGLGLSGQILSLGVASAGVTGALTGADWSTFNNKQNALTFGNLTDAGTDGIVITGGSGSVIGAGTSIAQHVADASHNGYLSSSDWSTFNGKQAALTIGDLTDTGTDGITVTGGSGAVIGTGTAISQHVADTTHNGYLASSDWNTFNGKQAAGNYLTALTGDATAAGPGSSVLTFATVNANVGSFGTASSVSAVTVNGKGLVTAAANTAIQIAESQVTNLVSDLAGKQPVGNYITALTGDATASGPGSAALTLATVASAGTTGSSTAIPVITINAKGLTTSISTAAVVAPAGTLTGTTLASNVVTSSLTSVGTIATGVWNGSVIASTYVGLGRTINAQSGTTYTFVIGDGSSAGGNPLVTASNASAQTYTVPTNASVAFPVGTQIDLLQQGAGKVTVAAAGGVTIHSKSGNLSISGQYVAVSLIKTATDTWTLIGDLIA